MPQETNPVRLRLANSGDAPAIASLLYRSFLEYEPLYTSKGFAATVTSAHIVQSRLNEGPVWIAVENDKIVGTVSVVLKDDWLYIRGMAVDPAARGHQIGWRLLDCAEEFAKKGKCIGLFLSTTPFLSRAINLYENYGFSRSEDGPDNLFGTPLFTMKKPIH